MRKGIIGCVIVLVASLTFLGSVPGGASAATTWTVTAGSSKDNQALQALRFLPQEITINEGDAVKWVVGAADHTIYFPAGQKPPELIIPSKTKGELLFNTAVVFPSPTKTYDGSRPLSGGAIFTDDPKAPKSYSVTFTKAGTYKYMCMFHPGMEGTIRVQAAGRAYPKTQAQYNLVAAQEARAALAKAQQLLQANKPVVTGAPGKRTYTLNLVGSSKDAVTLFRFPAQRLEIRRGETVTWVTKDPSELHTVTFGAKDPFEIMTMKPQAQGPPLVLANLRSMNPAGGKLYKGPGFYNSGWLSTDGPGPRSYTLTFTKSGTYEYECTVHDFWGMKATIVVK